MKIPGKTWGIWNRRRKHFNFNIYEPSEHRASWVLRKKTGFNRDFEIRRNHQYDSIRRSKAVKELNFQIKNGEIELTIQNAFNLQKQGVRCICSGGRAFLEIGG